MDSRRSVSNRMLRLSLSEVRVSCMEGLLDGACNHCSIFCGDLQYLFGTFIRCSVACGLYQTFRTGQIPLSWDENIRDEIPLRGER